MDEQRFDTLTRRLATGTTRRTVLRGLLGGGALALLGAHGAAAKPKTGDGGGGAPKPPKPGGGGSGCKLNSDCPDDGNSCTAAVCDGSTGQCAQVSIVQGSPCGDNGICDGNGSCGECGPGGRCPGGSPGGFSCPWMRFDEANCGSCGNVCTADTPFCCAGACSAVFGDTCFFG